MDKVCQLQPRDVIKLDPEQLWLLERSLGSNLAEETANSALETIVSRICCIETAWEAGEFQRLAKSARMLVGVAEQVGMTSLAQVAHDVSGLAVGRDDAARAAVVRRLVRIGDASLAALWDTGESFR